MNTKALKTATIEQLPVANPTPMDLMQSMIERGVDAEQLDKMLTLQERWQESQARVAFANAIADFQANCPTIRKTKTADRGITYAPLDEVLRTIRPHLASAGLSVRFSTKMTETTVITTYCTVAHKDGYSETSEFSALLDEKMRVNDTQKSGSANSYAKRYALMNALNLVASDEDDDGYSAGSQFIDDHEIVKIKDVMSGIKSLDKPAFLRFLGVSKLEDLRTSDLPKAMNALKRKAKASK